jgi:hypothetical protein
VSKFDFQSLDKKNINEVLVIADNLSKKDLEDRLDAYKIYLSIIQINQVQNIYEYPNTFLRGIINEKIYQLEKSFNLNECFYSQSGQDKFINNLFFRNKRNGFFVEIGAYNGIDGSNCYFFEKFLTNFTNKYIIYNIIAVDAINNIEHPVVNIQLNIANCDSFSNIILFL